MDSSQSPPLNDPRVGVDVTAELTAPPPDPAWQPAPLAQSASVPSAKSFELINHLDALARDFAATSKRDPSNQRIETSEEASSISAGFEVEQPVIHVSPRDQFTTGRSSIGRRIPLTLAGLFVAALIGVGATFAWQTHRFSTTKSPVDVTEQTGSTAASHLLVQDAALPQSAPVIQTPPAPATPATSPELVRQLETMAQDLAAVPAVERGSQMPRRLREQCWHSRCKVASLLRVLSSVTSASAPGLVGLTSAAITAAAGIASWSNSNRFAARVEPPSQIVPVMLPPGRLKLSTRSYFTGSDPMANTIGIVAVAVLAGSAA
jgi:hypothetical protein